MFPSLAKPELTFPLFQDLLIRRSIPVPRSTSLCSFSLSQSPETISKLPAINSTNAVTKTQTHKVTSNINLELDPNIFHCHSGDSVLDGLHQTKKWTMSSTVFLWLVENQTIGNFTWDSTTTTNYYNDYTYWNKRLQTWTQYQQVDVTNPPHNQPSLFPQSEVNDITYSTSQEYPSTYLSLHHRIK